MSEVHAVLLVPEQGDPHGLLADGPCGARPPMAIRRTYPRVVHESNEWGDPTYNGEKCEACGQSWPCETPGKVESEGHVRWQPGNRHTTVPDALVLAWGGKAVPEGMDRLGRSPGKCETGWVREVVAVHLGQRPDDSDALTDPDLPGTLVLLDAEGREAAP
ncbi:MAG: hypothetical protein EB075_11455 [Bacteroidetes bacterium]|nr:hypothetical protein [Bacteroidota bacterium]